MSAREYGTPTPSRSVETRRTGVIDKLCEFAIMDHKQLVEPDHTERARRQGEKQYPPLTHQLCFARGKVGKWTDDDNLDDGFLLLGPCSPVPDLREKDSKHDQVKDVSNHQRNSEFEREHSPHDIWT